VLKGRGIGSSVVATVALHKLLCIQSNHSTINLNRKLMHTNRKSVYARNSLVWVERWVFAMERRERACSLQVPSLCTDAGRLT
jgi:hypothetical protein